MNVNDCLRCKNLLLFTILFTFCKNELLAGSNPSNPSPRKRNIVLIAGEKTHGPGFHEYIKTVKLLKLMLDHSNVQGIQTSFVLHGWPDDLSILEKADLILFFTDGGDGDSTMYPPFMKPGRMEFMEKQMQRGCGFSLIHYSTFSPDSYGAKVLEWGGGYFDWQDDNGAHNYYSAIKTTEGTVTFPDQKNPVTKGVHPFTFKEEFYYNMRFKENDQRLKPIVVVPELEGRSENGKVVAWTVERKDKGRGFSTTMGHYYSNWSNPDFRKLLLNGIVWAAGATVPANGVESRVYSDKEINIELYGKNKKALILSGGTEPLKEIAKPLQSAINLDKNFFTDISSNGDDLKQYDLNDYDVLVMDQTQWKDSNNLNADSKKALVNYLNEGGGLMLVNFDKANSDENKTTAPLIYGKGKIQEVGVDKGMATFEKKEIKSNIKNALNAVKRSS